MTQKRPTKNKLALASKLLLLVAVIVLFTGVVVSLIQHRSNSEVRSTYTDSQISPDTEKPDEDSLYNHRVEPDQPRYISIAALTVKAVVKSGGVNAENQIESPANIHETGWYNGSSKPGQEGAMLISGHVSSWETSGVFYDLKLLQPGDKITIERGDGAKFTFSVVKSQTYDANDVDMGSVLLPISRGKPGLNLITCAGEVIAGTNNFSKRIVVFAEQIDN